MELEAIASRLEAIASRLEAIASRLELEAIVSRLEAIASRLELEAIASRLELQSLVGWRLSLVGWWPSPVGWRPSPVGWRPVLLVANSPSIFSNSEDPSSSPVRPPPPQSIRLGSVRARSDVLSIRVAFVVICVAVVLPWRA